MALKTNKPYSAETQAAQAMGAIEPVTGAIVAPIDITTTYERDPDNGYSRGFIYNRPDNATVRRAEEVIASLEGAPVARVYSSGMSAAVAAFLGLPRPAHVIAPTVMYWALRKWLIEEGPGHGIETSFVDTDDLSAIEAAIRPGETKMIWLETPANPLWTISDIRAVADLAHQHDALLGVDSTIATPVLTRPLELGADVAMHSATKYLNGHSDVLAGALAFAREDGFFERAHAQRGYLGMVLGPYEAGQLLRGMRTLHVRVRHQCAAALALARHLNDHPAIEKVLYPGLPDHPQHELATRQMSGGYSGMVSVRLSGGEQAAIDTAARLKLFKRATSLGGVESLVEHRASIEGEGTPCPTDLLRISVGLEEIDDLKADWDQALPDGSWA